MFSLNTGKCGPEKTQYLDTFHVVISFTYMLQFIEICQNFNLVAVNYANITELHEICQQFTVIVICMKDSFTNFGSNMSNDIDTKSKIKLIIKMYKAASRRCFSK